MNEQLMGVKEIAEWLNVSPHWVRTHASGARKPQIPSVKIAGVLRFRREDIQATIDRYSRGEVA